MIEWVLAARQALLVLGCLASAVTDYRTGLIPNYITYPMIGLGVGLLFFSGLNVFALNAFFGLGIFLLGYLLYRSGKLGGGDVLLFTGIALLSPFDLGEFPFVLNVVFASALISLTFSSVYYVVRLGWKGKLSSGKPRDFWLALAIFLAMGLYFGSLWYLGYMKVLSVVVLYLPITFGLVFMIYRKQVYKEFFLETIPVSKIEEDEIVALEEVSDKVKKALNCRTLIGEKDLRVLRKAGIKSIMVYRNLPKLGPYIFLAVLLCIVLPDFFLALF